LVAGCGLIQALAAIAALIVLKGKGEVSTREELRPALGLDIFLPEGTNKFLSAFLGYFSVFEIWWIVMMVLIFAAAFRVSNRDVAVLYWTAAAWGGAVSVGKDDPALIAQVPQMEALIDRAAELDAAWGDGAIHSFLITYEMSRSETAGSSVARSRGHFERALQLSKGMQAGPLVTFAEAVCIDQQDATEFSRVLTQALAINPDTLPEYRLANLVMQRRARWLLAHQDDLFVTKKPK